MNVLFQISEATQASQVNMVPKAEPNAYRFTCDFRLLNDCCRKIDFQLPKIWDIITRIGRTGASHFAKIDLTQGFHQVPLHKDSRRFTSFRTCMGNYEYLRMAQGTKGAPQYFQLIMTEALKGLNGICEVYIDDILVHGKSEDELIANTETVLNRLREYDMTVNPRKTFIGLTKLEYLGLTLTSDRTIIVSEKRQDELGRFEKPTRWKGLKSFLGIVNVFHKQIQDCANLSKTLNAMIGGYTRAKSNLTLRWTKEAEQAFETLKARVQVIPKTHLMSKGMKTILRTDASDYGCGAHLLQKQILGTDELGNEIYGEELTIQFVSKSFDKTQLNWSTPEKECYGVWYACKTLQYMLESETFEIQVDHKNLTILKDSVNQKVQRWKNYLQRFDAKWRYIPGPDNTVADGLSRMVEPVSKEIWNEVEIREIILHLNECTANDSDWESGREVIPVHNHDSDKNPDTINAQTQDMDMGEVLLLTQEEEIALQAVKEYLRLLICKFHNKVNGHLGINKTMQCIETYMRDHPEELESLSKFTYKTKYDAVKEFIESCPICQKQSRDFEKLYTTPFVGNTYEPMQCVQIDHIGPIGQVPDAYGNRHILVIVDTFTRWTELYPVPDVGAETTAIMLGDYILRYGPPGIVHSDKGSAFIDTAFNALAKLAGIKITHPIAGDKESTGIVERENKEVRKHLNNLMNENFMGDKWTMAVKMVQRILNNTVHSTTGCAPAQLLYGKIIPQADSVFKKPDTVDEKEYSKYMKTRIDLQGKIIKHMRERMIYKDRINLANREHPNRQILEPGEYVLHRRKTKNKSQLEWTGPWIVTDKNRDHYRLVSINNDQASFEAHALNLKRFKLPDDADPKEIALMDANEYIIDEIREVVLKESAKNTPTSRYSQSYGVTYEGYPDDIHYFEYNDIKVL